MIVLFVVSSPDAGEMEMGGKTYLRYSVEAASPYNNYVALDRMYLIAKFKKGNLLVRFTTDVAPLTKLVGETSEKSAYSVYVKHAYVQWKAMDNAARTLKVQFGVAPTIWPGMEEKLWGHRFVEKTTYDYYKLEPTADMGLVFRYTCKLLPWELHTGVYNGNGFKNLENDPHKDVMGRLSVYPAEPFGMGKLVGIHIFGHTTTQGIGFKDRYIGGISLNHSLLTLMLSHAYYTSSYKSYVKGGSAFAILHLLEGRLNVFGRYDLMDDYTDPFIVGGLSYRVSGNLRFALSYKQRGGDNAVVSFHTEARF